MNKKNLIFLILFICFIISATVYYFMNNSFNFSFINNFFETLNWSDKDYEFPEVKEYVYHVSDLIITTNKQYYFKGRSDQNKSIYEFEDTQNKSKFKVIISNINDKVDNSIYDNINLENVTTNYLSNGLRYIEYDNNGLFYVDGICENNEYVYRIIFSCEIINKDEFSNTFISWLENIKFM